MKRVEEEPWLDCQYHGTSSSHNAQISQRMVQVKDNADQTKQKFEKSHKLYLEDLKKAPG